MINIIMIGVFPEIVYSVFENKVLKNQSRKGYIFSCSIKKICFSWGFIQILF